MQGLILAGGRGSRLAADGVDTPKALVEVGGRPQVVNLIEMFAELLNVPFVQAEASVRMGYMQLTLNEPAMALQSFQRGASSEDRFVRYLAHFLAGRALDRLGRRDEANAMYRSALLIIPAAQSASEALSANLFLAGAPDEAYEIAQYRGAPER